MLEGYCIMTIRDLEPQVLEVGLFKEEAEERLTNLQSGAEHGEKYWLQSAPLSHKLFLIVEKECPLRAAIGMRGAQE